ncbi:hypothetical protein TSTA_118700 [Talaromyces stipitatus ATCC 10500]|uniref:Uncharacterized protein n=1 Tax=Talaromyces stipitatus (strain ATCC 10500 / CBS 375.48 / QM 6759 / NRRL 1006) TaxID=441959 RepID=B8M9V2_TALSN|nr:uncharacterized protein TSTA_118700 [Talaromyces stipitatus ATCC 10500]EED18104.1 hypothetical protein TSTA_118700 [Talaromyces stipitatus ATCC 10500]
MKYTTALTVLLAFGPATTILAAPVSQDPTSALTGAPSGQNEGAKQPAAGPAPGSSSQGLSGSSSGNEGLLDKVEKIVKDVLGGLRKRGLVEEVGEVVQMTVDSTSKLLNGESSGSQSSYNTQSTDPDALSQGAPQGGKGDDDKDGDDKKAHPAPAPTPAPAPAPSKDSSSSSPLSKLIGGRSNAPLSDQTDPVNTSGTTAPISNEGTQPTESHKVPTEQSSPIEGVTKPSTPIPVPVDTKKQEGEKKEKEGPNIGTPTSDAFQLSPEEIEVLKKVLQSQSKDGQGEGLSKA